MTWSQIGQAVSPSLLLERSYSHPLIKDLQAKECPIELIFINLYWISANKESLRVPIVV